MANIRNITQYGTISLNIEKLLSERNISKNRICADMDIPRSNFNRYCQGDYQRLDLVMLCKIMSYLDVQPADLITYEPAGR